MEMRPLKCCRCGKTIKAKEHMVVFYENGKENYVHANKNSTLESTDVYTCEFDYICEHLDNEFFGNRNDYYKRKDHELKIRYGDKNQTK